ncbi:hypothetical protein J6590_013743 [Homalodisca vitripennis]|nr:hypothetical protein J6590_013743 [Homalodisca vitripennis]
MVLDTEYTNHATFVYRLQLTCVSLWQQPAVYKARRVGCHWEQRPNGSRYRVHQPRYIRLQTTAHLCLIVATAGSLQGAEKYTNHTKFVYRLQLTCVSLWQQPAVYKARRVGCHWEQRPNGSRYRVHQPRYIRLQTTSHLCLIVATAGSLQGAESRLSLGTKT